MVKKWRVTIPELTGRERRRVYLYLPTSYKYNRRRRYPVLYMFDGHNVFFDSDATYGKSWGMKDYMDYTDTPMIIVGVECNHSPDFGRLKEYSPFDFDDPQFGYIEGKGKITMDWFVNYLKPMIDKRYRTIPDREHTFISGSSMGGLMSVYALMEYNHVFSRAAALSPSLWTNPRQIEELIKNAPLHGETVLYMDYGENELKNHRGMWRKFDKAANLLAKRGILVTSRIVPGGEHCEASWERQLPFAINTLLYGIDT